MAERCPGKGHNAGWNRRADRTSGEQMRRIDGSQHRTNLQILQGK